MVNFYIAFFGEFFYICDLFVWRVACISDSKADNGALKCRLFQ